MAQKPRSPLQSRALPPHRCKSSLGSRRSSARCTAVGELPPQLLRPFRLGHSCGSRDTPSLEGVVRLSRFHECVPCGALIWIPLEVTAHEALALQFVATVEHGPGKGVVSGHLRSVEHLG